MITISLLSDIKFFLKKYLKNPALVAAAGYIVYRILKKYIKKESFAESIVVLEEEPKYSMIYDTKLKKYILICDKIYSSNNEDELRQFVKQKFKG